MVTVPGHSPNGRTERFLDIEIQGQECRVRVYPPNNPNGGWEILIPKESFLANIKELLSRI